MEFKPKLIIALDAMTLEKTKEVIEIITKNCTEFRERIIFKSNDLFDRIGAVGINSLSNEYGIRWMLDMKDVDIPTTMENSFFQLVDTGLAQNTEYITIMADAGLTGMKAVVDKRNATCPKSGVYPKLLAVSVLTSMNERDCQKKYRMSIKEKFLLDTKIILEAGCDGMICSLEDAKILREILGEEHKNFLLVTPGVRFQNSGSELHQKRVSNPGRAIQYDTDVVMGTDILSNLVEIDGKKSKSWKSEAEIIEAIQKVFAEFQETQKVTETNNFILDTYIFKRLRFEILKYIGAIYDRPQNENGVYVRWTSGIISQTYTNIGVFERNYRILREACNELAQKLENAGVEADLVLGAQTGSVRLSAFLAQSLGLETSVYAEKQGERELALNRHALDLKGKKVILSEDMITKGSTIAKMKYLVESQGGIVVAVTCIGNLSGKEEYEGLPFIYLFKPIQRAFYYDQSTLDITRKNMIAQGKTEQEIEEALAKITSENEKIPDNSKISEKAKNDWEMLVQSMR